MSELYVVIPETDNDNPLELYKCKNAVSKQKDSGLIIKIIETKGRTYQEAFNRALDKLDSGLILFIFPWIILEPNALKTSDLSIISDSNQDLIIYSFEKVMFNEPSSVIWDEEVISTGTLAKKLHNHISDTQYRCIWNKIFSLEKIKSIGLRFNDDLTEFFELVFFLEYLNTSKRIVFLSKKIAVYYTHPFLPVTAKARISERKKILNRYYKLLLRTCSEEIASKIIDKEKQEYYIYETLRLPELQKNERALIRKELKQLKDEITCLRFYIEVITYYRIVKGYIRKFAIKQFLGFIHHNFSKSKSILLYCESSTMKSHIFDYYDCVKNLEGIRYYIYYQDNWNDELPKGTRLIKRSFFASNYPWDAIICADIMIPFNYSRQETGLIYINHGLHMISYDGGNTLYAYDKGVGKFSAMMEPNRQYALELSKIYPKENIYYTGYKYAEKILTKKAQRLIYRSQLGIADGEKLVAVFGSWGEDSLFHTVGGQLISQAKDLMSEGYRFILSIHPKEYKKYDPVIEPLGEYINSLYESGFIIRRPDESSIEYIVASDLVICDCSTLCEEAMLIGRPVILSDFPEERVWKDSIVAKYKAKNIVFNNNSSLKSLIDKYICDSSLIDDINMLIKDILPPPSGYKQVIIEATRNVLKERMKKELE